MMFHNVFHDVLHGFHNVLLCLVSCAMIGICTCTICLQSATFRPPITAGIDDNAAGIGNNAKGTGDNAAEIVNNATKVIPC